MNTDKNFYHLDFTKRERITVAWLISIIIVVRVLPELYAVFMAPPSEQDLGMLDSLINHVQSVPLVSQADSTPVIKMFDFDPNKIEKDSMLLLGINQYTARNWLAFRKAGARFREVQDMYKIYGMDTLTMIRLTPFVRIKPQKISSVLTPEFSSTKILSRSITRQPEKEILPAMDINSASSEELLSLKGIGPVFSQRIVKYRNLLGGFHSVQQLKEIYGLSEDTYHLIEDRIMVAGKVIQLDPSMLSFKELLRHPYISYGTAQIIYTHHKGPFENMDSILRTEMDSTAYINLFPYLKRHK